MGDEYREALVKALKILSIKSRHSFEIHERLTQLDYPETIIKPVMKELKRLRYIDDKDWIKCFVRGQIARKFGKHAILQKLSLKGILTESVRSIIDSLQTDEQQRKLIKSLLNTRYRSKDLADFKQKQQVIAGLARKGFSFSLIQEALKD